LNKIDQANFLAAQLEKALQQDGLIVDDEERRVGELNLKCLRVYKF